MMPLKAFDHVNLRTHRLDEMIAWYSEILGMAPGWRPDFPFPGAWLYLGDQAMVHLVGVDTPPKVGGDISLEHFALRATGFSDFVNLLQDQNIRHEIIDAEILPVVQVNVWDPDGNHIHIDFSRDEG